MTQVRAERESLLAKLSSSAPSQRMGAARALAPPLSKPEQRRVLAAIQRESVPQIRALMERLLAAGQYPATERSLRGDDHASGDDISKLIVHELAPAIGRIDLEASIAIPDYENSPMALAVEGLRRRVSALAKIASTRRERVELKPTNLLEVVQRAVAGRERVIVEVTPEESQEEQFIVRTDSDLLTMLLDAALNNASQAHEQTESTESVVVEVNTTGISASVSIVNKFNGTSVSKEQVLALGRTTRFGGLGVGTRVIAGAADKLGLDWDFQGTAGVATFMLRFVRP